MYINYSTSSGLKTESSLISPFPGSLMGIDVKAPSSGVNIITLYDSENPSVNGKLVLCEVEADAGMVSINHEFFVPVVVNRGIYALVSGTGEDCSYIVRFAL